MTPPISKDWWIAAALTGATLPGAHAQTAPAPGAGIVSAITASAPATANKQTVVVGDSVQPGETLRTGPNGQLHLLFLDQSSVTMGPGTELVIDTFNYDPATRQGEIRLRLNQGLVRVVGGHISKNTATAIITDVGRVETRGGITIVNYTPPLPNFSGNQQPALNNPNNPGLSSVFMFGQSMRATDNSGNTQTITRPGFGTTISGNGAPSTPERVPVNQISDMLNRLETRPNPGNQSNPNPAPGGGGNLISTGNSGGTGGGSPGSTLANDRLKNLNDLNSGSNPTSTLQFLLGSSNVQPNTTTHS